MAGLWKIIKPLTSANTNRATNPSVETATTNWSALGSNTIARSTAQQWRGLYSLLCTYQDNTILGRYAHTFSSTNTTYYVKIRIYVPSNWDGGDISIDFTNYTSATETVVVKYTDGTDPTDTWIELESTIGIALDAAGSIDIKASSAPTAGRTVYVDALYISTVDAEYFDGDSDGAEWSGTEHASSSTMSPKSRNGGQAINLDDYATYIESHTGAGMPPISNRLRSLALQQGAQYLGYNVQPRLITLVRTTIGTSLANLHSQRKDLIDAIKGDLVAGALPFLLIYTGAHDAKEVQIQVVYDAGLEFGGSRGFAERGAIRLLAYNPLFQDRGDKGVSLNTQNSDANVNYILSRQAGDWSNMDQGVSAAVQGLAVAPSRLLYVGGQFTTIGSGATSANRAASWDPATSTWAALGSGLNDQATVVRVHPNGTVYFGGAFTTAGGSTRNRIATWNGSTWGALGTGLNAAVNDILIARDGNIYVTGAFTTAGGGSANYVAYWDGSAWNAMGTGLNATGLALAEDQNGNIYVAGQFTTAGGSSANYVAKWDGSSWSALGSGMNAKVNDLLVSDSGLIYAVGAFTTADGNTANRIAYWTGAAWYPVGSGFDNEAITIAENEGLLYIGGTFTTAGGISTTDGVAIWNGASYANVDVDFPSSPSGFVFAFDNYAEDPITYYGFTLSGTAVYGETTTVTNPGTASAWPRFVFKRTGGTTMQLVFLKNENTGQTLWLNYSLLSGEKVTIDLRPGHKTIESNYFGNIIGTALLPNSDLASFQLLPGDNKITLLILKSGSPDVTAYVLFRPLYWSLDGVSD